MHKLWSKLFGKEIKVQNRLESPLNPEALHPTLCSLFDVLESNTPETLVMAGISEEEVKMFVDAFNKGEIIIGLSPAMAYAILCNYVHTLPEPVLDWRILEDYDVGKLNGVKVALNNLPPATVQFLCRLFGVVVTKLMVHGFPSDARHIVVEQLASSLCGIAPGETPPEGGYNLVLCLMENYHQIFKVSPVGKIPEESSQFSETIEWIHDNTAKLWKSLFHSSALTLEDLAVDLDKPEHIVRYVLTNIHENVPEDFGTLTEWDSAVDFFLNPWTQEEINAIVESFMETRGVAKKMHAKVPSKTLKQINFFLRMITKTSITREEYLWKSLKGRSLLCKCEADIATQFTDMRLEDSAYEEQIAQYNNNLNKVFETNALENDKTRVHFQKMQREQHEAMEKMQREQHEAMEKMQAKQQKIQQKAYMHMLERTPRKGLAPSLDALGISGRDIPSTPTLAVTTPLRLGRCRSTSTPSPSAIMIPSHASKTSTQDDAPNPYPKTPMYTPKANVHQPTISRTTSTETPIRQEVLEDSHFEQSTDSKPKPKLDNVLTRSAAKSAKGKFVEDASAEQYDAAKNKTAVNKLNRDALRAVLAKHNKRTNGTVAELRLRILKAEIDCTNK